MVHWWHFWWLVFPAMWFVFGILRMVLGHRHRRDTLELLRTYATQGKEPPPELLKVLQNDDPWRGRRWRGPQRLWYRVVTLGSLSIGFGVMAYLRHSTRPDDGLIFVSVILGCFALGSLLIALNQPTPDPSKPQEPHEP